MKYIQLYLGYIFVLYMFKTILVFLINFSIIKIYPTIIFSIFYICVTLICYFFNCILIYKNSLD